MTKREIVHVEIPAANREAAAQFYKEVFGWKFEHHQEPVPYTTFQTGNVPGGFPDMSSDYKPGDVVVYIDSDDLDADLKQITAHGGHAIGPKLEVPGMGWFAFFADPSGNRLALWKADGMQR